MSAEQHIAPEKPLALAIKQGTMAMATRQTGDRSGTVGMGTGAMRISTEDSARARLLDEAIGQLLRGEKPSLEQDEELSSLLEVAHLRYRLSSYLRQVAITRQQAVWGQIRSALGLDTSSPPSPGA